MSPAKTKMIVTPAGPPRESPLSVPLIETQAEPLVELDETLMTVRVAVPPGIMTGDTPERKKASWEVEVGAETAEAVLHDDLDPAAALLRSVRESMKKRDLTRAAIAGDATSKSVSTAEMNNLAAAFAAEEDSGEVRLLADNEKAICLLQTEASDRCRHEANFLWSIEALKKTERSQQLVVFETVKRNFEFDEQWEREAFEEDSVTEFNDVTWKCYQSLMQDELLLDEGVARKELSWSWVKESLKMMQHGQEHVEYAALVEVENTMWWEIMLSWQVTTPSIKVQHQWYLTRLRLHGWEDEDRRLIEKPESISRAQAEGAQIEFEARAAIEQEWFETWSQFVWIFDYSVREVLLSYYAPPGDTLTVATMTLDAAVRIQHMFRSKRGQPEARILGARLRQERAISSVKEAPAATEEKEDVKTEEAPAKKTTNELVTESWAVVCGAFTFDQVGKLFYDALFEKAPALKDTVFSKTDMTVQPIVLIKTIDAALKFLDRPEELVPALIRLGERHAAYGPTEAHYTVLGEVFVGVLAAVLGEEFTDDVKTAWVEVYTVIQTNLLEGQNSEKGKEMAAAVAAKKAEEAPEAPATTDEKKEDEAASTEVASAATEEKDVKAQTE